MPYVRSAQYFKVPGSMRGAEIEVPNKDYESYWDRISKQLQRVGDSWNNAAQVSALNNMARDKVRYEQNYGQTPTIPKPNYGPQLAEKVYEKPIIRDIDPNTYNT